MSPAQALSSLLNLLDHWPSAEEVRASLKNLSTEDFPLLIKLLGEEIQKNREDYEFARKPFPLDSPPRLSIEWQYRCLDSDLSYLLKLVGYIAQERRLK